MEYYRGFVSAQSAFWIRIIYNLSAFLDGN